MAQSSYADSSPVVTYSLRLVASLSAMMHTLRRRLPALHISHVKCVGSTLSLSLLLCCTGFNPTLYAAYHLWQITEVFSNADGSVQFIEMFDCCNGENYVNGQTLEAVSDGMMKTFTFPSDIPLNKPTGGKSMLIATPGFANLTGGVTPDFTLPDPAVSGPFFNPNAASVTITFPGSFSSITGNASNPIPTDGRNSLRQSSSGMLSTGVNSPTNVDMQSGSVDLVPPTPTPTGDYNGNGFVDAADYVVWSATLNESETQGQGADGNANGMIDEGDYDFWRARFGNVIAAAGADIGAINAPEPATVGLLLASFLLAVHPRIRARLSEN
jgi:hypothetical protein